MRASATGIARLDFVRPDLLPERLADHLREAIVDGRLKPGQRLVEQQLAGEWRVSRAPLREALRMLAVEGLVTLSPHRGATVTEVSATELEELFAVRGLLESFAAACAAARKPHAELERMHAILDDMRGLTAKADLAGYYRLAADFHDALVHASGNSVLARLHDLVKRQFRRYQAVMVRLPGLPRHSISEHVRIVRAIEAGSATQARAAATRHVTSLMRQFRRHERVPRGRPT